MFTEKDLSPDQRDAYDAIVSWAADRRGRNIMTLGGYAGSGKTSVLGVLAKKFEEDGLLVAYAAYTGRAASILARKLREAGVETTTKLHFDSSERRIPRGLGHLYEDFGSRSEGPPRCGTIHSLLYRPVLNERDELTGWTERDGLDRDYDMIVTDESSMVGDEMLFDLKRYGIPILAVGDHGQLPPVQARGDLMQKPILRLEKIHRQAEKSPIIRLAHRVRLEGRLKDFRDPDGGVCFEPKRALHDVLRAAVAGRSGTELLATGALCWTNKQRIQLNRALRHAVGFDGWQQKSEIVICLKNMPPIYNGMRGVLTADAITPDHDGFTGNEWTILANVEFPDEGVPARDIRMCAPQFDREKTIGMVEDLKALGIDDIWSMKEAGAMFDFGYALTVHKSQGSQFEHAILYLDRPERPTDEDWRRWAYTAVTRAADKLTVLV